MTSSADNSGLSKLIRWPQASIYVAVLLLIHSLARWQVAASSGYLWSAVICGAVLFTTGASIRRAKPEWFEIVFIPLIVIPQRMIYQQYYPNYKDQSLWDDLGLTLQWVTLSLVFMIFLFLLAIVAERRRVNNSRF